MLPCAALAQDVPPHVDALLKQIKAADKDQLASPKSGRFLRLLAVTRGAKRALEIGAASGYSAIWMGLAMRETGGKLVTIEYDKARAAEAAANIKKAGLSDVVQVFRATRLPRFLKFRARSISCSAMRGSATTRNSSRWCSRAWTRGAVSRP